MPRFFGGVARGNLDRRTGAVPDRYSAHLVVAKYWQSLLTLPEKTLSGTPRKSLAYQRKKLGRDVEKPLQKATALYGSAFKRQWSSSTFRDRVSRSEERRVGK